GDRTRAPAAAAQARWRSCGPPAAGPGGISWAGGRRRGETVATSAGRNGSGTHLAGCDSGAQVVRIVWVAMCSPNYRSEDAWTSERWASHAHGDGEAWACTSIAAAPPPHALASAARNASAQRPGSLPPPGMEKAAAPAPPVAQPGGTGYRGHLQFDGPPPGTASPSRKISH